MKADVCGCSTTTRATEQVEEFWSGLLRKDMVQYDYRTAEGELFSCVSESVENARRLRDKWLTKRRVRA